MICRPMMGKGYKNQLLKRLQAMLTFKGNEFLKMESSKKVKLSRQSMTIYIFVIYINLSRHLNPEIDLASKAYIRIDPVSCSRGFDLFFSS